MAVRHQYVRIVALPVKTTVKLWVLSIIAAICCQVVYAQPNKTIDSLLNVLKTQKEDSNKVNDLNSLFKWYFEARQYTNAGRYAHEALVLAEKIKFKKGVANSYNSVGKVNAAQHNYQEALNNLFVAIKIRDEIGDKSGIADAYEDIGGIYRYQCKYPEALKYFFSGLKIRDEAGDKKGISDSYINIASVYASMSDLDKSRCAETIKYYQAALKIKRELGDKKAIAIACYGIGVAYDDEDNFPEALKNYEASLKIDLEIGDTLQMTRNYHAIGEIYRQQNKYPEALKNYEASLMFAEGLKDTFLMAVCYLGIGNTYISSRDFKKAEKYLVKGMALSKTTNHLSLTRAFCDIVSKLYYFKGDYKKAVDNYRVFVKLKDSLINETNNKQIAELKEKYESEKKEKEIALLNKDKMLQAAELRRQKQSKNYAIAGLALIALVSFFAYNNYRTRQQLKLQTLRNKIARDLHDDVGSTLNSLSIYSQVAKQNPEQHDEALDMISESSRKVIDNMSDIIWAINPEIDSFEKIISRMRSLTYSLFRAKNIEFTFRADEQLNDVKINIEDRRNFYFIFKEAINNTLKYAEATRVAISLEKEGHFVTLTIKDNGKGFDVAVQSGGNGLNNMKKRAEEMNALLNIESAVGEGTAIELKFKT